MLIITATIPTLPPLFQKQSTTDGSSYLLRKMPATSYRQGSSNTARARVSQVHEYGKEPSDSSIGTTQSTPTTDQYQRSYDDGTFSTPFDSNGRRKEINVA